jgi:predicted TIM-barrel fold metal-dependent hydrolase
MTYHLSILLAAAGAWSRRRPSTPADPGGYRDLHRGHPPPHAPWLLLGSHRGRRPTGAIAPRWSRASALSFLDDAGIDVAITSISTPGVHSGDDAAARLLARRCNKLAAELIRDRPDRFGGFACLPLPDVDGALAELAYALDDLQLDGVLLFSNACGVYLGDSQFTSLFDEPHGARPRFITRPGHP